MRIKDLQLRLPWTIKYSRDFRSNPQAHKDFAHALTHVTKASGKLAQFVDDADHDMDTLLPEFQATQNEYRKYVADLVICALRMANTFPGGHFDLEDEIVNRLETKNNIKL